MSEEKKFSLANHKLGIAGAILFTVMFGVFKVIYTGLRSPYEAAFSARQVEDSAVVWNVTHNIINNDAFLWVTGGLTLALVLMCLVPAIKDALSN